MISTTRVGVVLGIVVLLLAGADAWFKERPHRLALRQQNAQTTAPEPTEDAETQLPVQPSSATSSSASERLVVKKGTSTPRKSGIDVQAVLASLQLIAQPTSEMSLLPLAAPNLPVQTMVLIQNNDRAALFSWIESDDVKTVFSSLKTALQEQFSPKLTHLVDKTQTPREGPPVDILSFNDPAISTEDVLFLRVRTRLYELHIVEKAKNSIDLLIAELSK